MQCLRGFPSLSKIERRGYIHDRGLQRCTGNSGEGAVSLNSRFCRGIPCHKPSQGQTSASSFSALSSIIGEDNFLEETKPQQLYGCQSSRWGTADSLAV
eukprot:1032050-Prorocentrum_minimum.AAC.2